MRSPPEPGGGPPPRPLEPIGAGGSRDCFAHPDDPRLCIKVAKSARGAKASAREARYLARVERRFPDADLARLPRYRGRVATDRGPGWVQDRVTDASGRPSPTLLAALDVEALARDPERWRRGVEEFRRWALALPVLLRDLAATNVCARTAEGGDLELVPIDGYVPRGTWRRWFPDRRLAAERNAAELRAWGFDATDALLASVERVRRDASRAELHARPTRLVSSDAPPGAARAGCTGPPRANRRI